MCFRSTSDPIADILYKEDRFMILDRGRSPDQLTPGMILRKPGNGRDVVFGSGSRLFSNWFQSPVSDDPYVRIDRKLRSSKNRLSAAIEASQVFAPSAPSAAELKSAMEESNIQSFRLGLQTPRFHSLDLDDFEARMRELIATEVAMDYLQAGQRFFLVTDTLTVQSGLIELNSDKDTMAFLDSKAESLAKAGINVRRAAALSATLSVQGDGEQPVVIAIKLVEITITDGRVTRLGAPNEKLTIRENTLSFATLDTMQDGDDLLLKTEVDFTQQ